jgi:hypothetical protein
VPAVFREPGVHGRDVGVQNSIEACPGLSNVSLVQTVLQLSELIPLAVEMANWSDSRSYRRQLSLLERVPDWLSTIKRDWSTR